MVSLRALLLAFALLAVVRSAKPPNWKVCKKGTPERNECLKKAINEAIHSLDNGDRKLGVLPIEPFDLGRIHTKGDPNGPVALDIVFKQFTLYNVKNLRITDVDLTGRTLKLKGEVPGRLEARSPYTVKGKILTLPLTGDGPSNFTFHDGNFTYDITFKEQPEIRKGKKYLVVEKFVERSFPKKLDIYLGNLFNGNKLLGDTVNNVLNENWDMFWNELKPLLEDAISEAFLQLSNRVFSKIPANELDLF